MLTRVVFSLHRYHLVLPRCGIEGFVLDGIASSVGLVELNTSSWVFEPGSDPSDTVISVFFDVLGILSVEAFVQNGITNSGWSRVGWL